MNPKPPSPRGSSLIEAMAALVVFSVGILGVMQMNVVASKQNNVAQAQTVASKLARDVADSFERLPFDHPLLNHPTALDPSNSDVFSNIDNDDGLVTLQEAMESSPERPILGASQAIFQSDTTFWNHETKTFAPGYEVAWRAKKVPNPQRYGVEDQIRIAIMVRFPTPGGHQVVKTWTVKYDPALLSNNPETTQEP